MSIWATAGGAPYLRLTRLGLHAPYPCNALKPSPRRPAASTAVRARYVTPHLSVFVVAADESAWDGALRPANGGLAGPGSAIRLVKSPHQGEHRRGGGDRLGAVRPIKEVHRRRVLQGIAADHGHAGQGPQRQVR